MVFRLKQFSLSGASHLSTGRLANMLRGMAQDLAQTKIQNAQLIDFTDSSGGTAAASFAEAVVPSAAFDATSAGGALRTDFNTAMTAFQNGLAVVADNISKARGRLGLPVIAFTSGAIATAGTIPAQTLSVTTTSGATSLDYASGRAVMLAAKANLRVLAEAYNELLIATGRSPIPVAMTGDFSMNKVSSSVTARPTLTTLATAAASATGASAISKAVADAFLVKMAAGLATIAASWNILVTQGTVLTDLTDSTGGTANTSNTLVANPLPVAANGAATTSSPKAGFDTEIAVRNTATASLLSRINALRQFQGLAAITDSTTGTPSTTLASESVNLTAVDGSTGTVAVDQVTGRARLGVLNNAVASMAAAVNELCDIYGQSRLIDLSGGTVSTTVANGGTATATGVSGVGATLLDADVDTWLTNNRNHHATIAAKLNAITGTGQAMEKPLAVVAG